MKKSLILIFLVFVTYVSTASLDKYVEEPAILNESKLEPSEQLVKNEENGFERKLNPIQETEYLKPVEENVSLKPVQENVSLKPVKEIGFLKPVQGSAFFKPEPEIGYLKPVQGSAFLQPDEEIGALKPVQEDSENLTPEEVNSETPLKIIFGGNKCKEVISKTADGKVFTSWLDKNCHKPFPQPQKPLFNYGFGTLPIPIVPPRMPEDLPKFLKPLLPVQ